MATTRPSESLERQLERVTADRDDLERLALRDPLTGLLNRRGLADSLSAELARAGREGYPVTLVALDIDFFKQVNDLYGHAAGDEVLERVAERLAAGIRPGDLCARLGGDEFMLAFPNADAARAAQVLSRIETAVAAIEFGRGEASLAFSGGIAEFPADSTGLADLMEHADAALFAAKAAGRHRVRRASSEVETSTAPDLGSLERHRLNVQNTIEALARAVDARNGYTHRHSNAVAFYAVSLALALGVGDERVEQIRRAGVLHDVGKIGVPDAILWKEGPLAAEEVAVMRRHSEIGHDILLGAGLPEIAGWVTALHERFDGDGYPNGLAGEAIPFESRLLKVVDAFDAMTSPRLYRDPLTVEEALAELESGAGSQFDPNLVARLMALVRSGELRAGERGR